MRRSPSWDRRRTPASLCWRGSSTTRRSSRRLRSTWPRLSPRTLARARAGPRSCSGASCARRRASRELARSRAWGQRRRRRAAAGRPEGESAEMPPSADPGAGIPRAQRVYFEVPLDAGLDDRLDQLGRARALREGALWRRVGAGRGGARALRPRVRRARARVQGNSRAAPCGAPERGARLSQSARGRRLLRGGGRAR